MSRRRAVDREPVEEIAEEAAEQNPDPQTRRETFELDLMDEDRSEEGEDIEVEEVQREGPKSKPRRGKTR